MAPLPRLIAAMAPWKRDLAQPIRDAVYHAAVGMTDDEITALVKETLIIARRHLSS